MINRNRLPILLAILLGAAPILSARVPDQPHMDAALAFLNTAQNELKVAEHNKGGHRANALKLTNQAISEVNRGIEYARTHNHAIGARVSPDQPHMEAALSALKSARDELVQANADKGGHRANALKLINAAIDEVSKGIVAGA